jgi:predicted lipid-binding transport protein (Tim44 family)
MNMEMMTGYWDIVIFAVIAVVLLWRLRSVFGARNETDPPPVANPYNVVKPLPEKEETKTATMVEGTPTSQAASPVNWSGNLPNYDIVASATAHHRLIPFAAVAPDFRPDDFIDKAKKAFGLIVNAFAAGDKKTLEFLLSPALYKIFCDQIDARQPGDTYQAQLIGIKSAMITDAQLDGTQGLVTVDFRAEQSILHKRADNTIVDRLDGTKRTHLDRWVFSKNLKDAADPKWLLIRTEEIE